MVETVLCGHMYTPCIHSYSSYADNAKLQRDLLNVEKVHTYVHIQYCMCCTHPCVHVRILHVWIHVCMYISTVCVFVHSAFCVTYALVLYSVHHNSSCPHEQLEEKTQTELQTLKEKIAKMTEEIGVYSDIQGLEKQEEERREVQPACTKDVVNTSHHLLPTCMYTYIHMYVCMCSQSILYTPCMYVCMYVLTVFMSIVYKRMHVC